MINITLDLYAVDKHLKLMNDSVEYISNRLETYYNTDQERSDIQRNIEYLKTALNKDFISSQIPADQLRLILNTIDKAESKLKQ